jgi:hypothetical protein
MNDSRNVPLMGDLNTVVCMDEVNSCVSGSRNFIIFLYFIHLRRKLNSLQRYDIAQNYRILHRVIQRLSQHNLKMIQMKLTGISMINTLFQSSFHLSKYNGSWVVSTKQNVDFNIQTAAMFVFFVFNKNSLIKSCSSFEDLSVHKISWSHVDRWKFFIHLRRLNVRHFGMLEGTGLISTASRSPSMAWPPYWIS